MITSSLNIPSISVKVIPEGERPRERLLLQGPDVLTSIELIAVVLGSGSQGQSVLQVAQELMVRFGSLQGIAEATIQELCQIRGMGSTKAAQLKAAFALGERAAKPSETTRPLVKTPRQAYLLVKDNLQSARKEHFMVILLDAKCCVIAQETVAIGILSQALVHPREVFYPAIRHTAAGLVLAHNHPSGDPTPSQEDIEMTHALIHAGRTMGIPVQDHIIVGREDYVSMRQSISNLQFDM